MSECCVCRGQRTGETALPTDEDLWTNLCELHERDGVVRLYRPKGRTDGLASVELPASWVEIVDQGETCRQEKVEQ